MPITHTPGPWEFTDDHSTAIVWAGNMRVCDLRGWGHLTGIGALNLPPEKAAQIQNANGRLIAAAPELLEACLIVQRFLLNLERGIPEDDPLRKIRQHVHAHLHEALDVALGKVTGNSQRAYDGDTKPPSPSDASANEKGTA